MPSIIISLAPGIALAVALPPEGLIILSTVPWMTSVGALISASLPGAIARGDDRAELPAAGAHVEAAVIGATGALADVLLVAREAGRADQAEDLGRALDVSIAVAGRGAEQVGIDRGRGLTLPAVARRGHDRGE